MLFTMASLRMQDTKDKYLICTCCENESTSYVSNISEEILLLAAYNFYFYTIFCNMLLFLLIIFTHKFCNGHSNSNQLCYLFLFYLLY